MTPAAACTILPPGAANRGGFLPVVRRLSGAPPARLLNRPVLQIIRRYRRKQPVHAVVAPAPGRWKEGYRTPRGILDALEGKLDPALKLKITIDATALEEIPYPFWPKKTESPEAALKAGNCGLGLVMVVAPYYARSIERQLRRRRVKVLPLGEVG